MSSEANHLKFMEKALKQASLAGDRGEVPVGAVVVCDGEIIAETGNRKEEWEDPTAHAEILGLKEAAQKLGRWRLTDCDIYVTLEPCVMCAGALVAARVRNLYYATEDPKAGGCGSVYNLVQSESLNHRINVEGGLFREEASKLLKSFFNSRRS